MSPVSQSSEKFPPRGSCISVRQYLASQDLVCDKTSSTCRTAQERPVWPAADWLQKARPTRPRLGAVGVSSSTSRFVPQLDAKKVGDSLLRVLRFATASPQPHVLYRRFSHEAETDLWTKTSSNQVRFWPYQYTPSEYGCSYWNQRLMSEATSGAYPLCLLVVEPRSRQRGGALAVESRTILPLRTASCLRTIGLATFSLILKLPPSLSLGELLNRHTRFSTTFGQVSVRETRLEPKFGEQKKERTFDKGW